MDGQPRSSNFQDMTNLHLNLQIDADQLEVQLGQEFIEIKDVLLKSDFLNEQLVPLICSFLSN